MSNTSSPVRRRTPAIWRDYGRFIALPRPQHRAIRIDRQWGQDFLALFALNWIGLLLCLAAVVGIRLIFGAEQPPQKPWPRDPAFLAAMVIMIAPFFEELIFRSWFPVIAWLRRFGSALRLLYPVAIWASTLIFGLVHLGNFQSLPNSVFAMAWVAPQLWSGTIYAFARVRLGFFGAFLLHAMSNAVVFSVIFAVGLPKEDLRCVPMKSGNIRCTTESGKTEIVIPPKPINPDLPN